MLGFFAARTRFGVWFRNVALNTMSVGPLARLLAGSVRDDIDLPDYDFPDDDFPDDAP